MSAIDLLPVVTPVVYLIVDRLKVYIPERRHYWIPELSAITGLLLVGAGLAATWPHDYDTVFRVCIEAVLLGYAATGIHTARKGREVS